MDVLRGFSGSPSSFSPGDDLVVLSTKSFCTRWPGDPGQLTDELVSCVQEKILSRTIFLKPILYKIWIVSFTFLLILSS